MFQGKNLAVIGYAGGFTVWSYKTNDTYADVTRSSYFSLVRPGDMIFCSVEIDDAMNGGLLVVIDGTDGLTAVEAGFNKREEI